jgi:hypothetical protein
MQALRVRLIQDPFNDCRVWKKSRQLVKQFAATSNSRFQFTKRG